VAQHVQDHVLQEWRFLLAAWPSNREALDSISGAFKNWLRSQRQFGRRLRASSHRDITGLRQWLLAQLYVHSTEMTSKEVGKVLATMFRQQGQQRKTQGKSVACCSEGFVEPTLAAVAESMRRHRWDAGDRRIQIEVLSLPPLLLFTDSVLGQLPLEACPCLTQRQLVRGIAPSIAVRSWEAEASRQRQSSGSYYVVDPSSGANSSSFPSAAKAPIASNVLSLFSEWQQDTSAIDNDGTRCWTGHVGSPGPDSAEVLQQLAARSTFLYMGHGECAKRLLPSERLEQGAPYVSRRNTNTVSSTSAIEVGSSLPRVPLQSVVALMGCSSARLVNPSAFASLTSHCVSSLQPSLPPRCESEEFEAFGLPLSLLIGGSPAVLGAAWDVLAGDVDRLTCALLRAWVRGKRSSGQSSFLGALVKARAARACMLPNLTGASLVSYGIPV
jgi:hypothetical protein